MKSLRHYGTAAILLLCSSSFALAETGIPFHVSDNLVLTGAQEQLIRHLVPKPVRAQARSSRPSARICWPLAGPAMT